MALPVLTEREAGAYSPNVLAFYGDCVYELLVRREVVLRGNTNAGRLHDLAVEQVRASYQSRAVDVIEPMLNEKESDILRRGRNAGGISVPKSEAVRVPQGDRTGGSVRVSQPFGAAGTY